MIALHETHTHINEYSLKHTHTNSSTFFPDYELAHTVQSHTQVQQVTSNRFSPLHSSLLQSPAACSVGVQLVGGWRTKKQHKSKHSLTFLAVVCYQKRNASSVAENLRYTDRSLSLMSIQILIKNTLANKSLTRENTQNELTWSANRYKVNRVPFLQVWKRLTIN